MFRETYLFPFFYYLNHLMDVALGSGEFRRIFDFDKHDKVQIMPHIVLHTNVLLKSHIFVVKGFALQSANKARVFQRFFLLLFLRTQIREGIDDHAENEIEYNDNDNEKEDHIVYDSEREQGLASRWRSQHISDSSAISQS